MQTTEIELTPDYVNGQLKRLFKALERGFANPEIPGEGSVKAVEFVEQLAELIESDPMMLATVFTERNLNALKELQRKQLAGSVGPMDFLQAFPEIGAGLKSVLNPFKKSK